MKKRWFLLVILISVISINQILAQSSNPVCCANPATTIDAGDPQLYCYDADTSSMLTEAQCCPTTGGYDDTNPRYPDNQQDCEQNFASATCTNFAPCTSGCCYDITEADPTQICSASLELPCMQINETNRWGVGFPEGSRLETGNPCYSDELLASNEYRSWFPQCPTRDTCSETTLTQQECIANPSCVYCPDTASSGAGNCYAQCTSCGGYSIDIDTNGVCDSDQGFEECPSQCGQVVDTCSCGTSIAQPGEYCCAGLSEIYTIQSECQNNCFYSCFVNRQISISQSAYGTVATDCVCGSDVVALDASGWCCDYGDGRIVYNGTACYEWGTVRGNVLDIETNEPIQGVRVSIGEQSVFTDAGGYYEIPDLLFGMYDVEVTHQNYRNQQTSMVLTQALQTLNFNLNPSIPRCANPNAGPIEVNPRIECSYGEKGFIVSWDNPCPENIIGFTVYRNYQTIAPLVKGTTFFDSEFEWESYVIYTVQPLYDYLTPQYNYSTNRYFTGYEECLNNPGMEVCVDNTGYRCSECNMLSNRQACQAGEVCLGPNRLGLTVCKIIQECKDMGVPLGIFYDDDDCHGVFNDFNYCFYDYSSTTIDKCSDCSSTMTCYDYQSEGACLQDNCVAAIGASCVYNFTNRELGKGICYQPDYDGGEYCGECNELFMDCSNNNCNMLGRCYLSGGMCNECSTTKCDDYTNQQDCTGGQNFLVDINPLCPADRTEVYSNDICDLKYCKWSNGICFKDADNNNIPDVDYGDYIPPTTTLDVPTGVLGIGSEIEFWPSESSDTYYCIDQLGNCCPNQEVLNNKIVLPEAIPESIRGEGWYYLRYYSQDSYGNLEEAQQTLIYVDLMPPIVIDLTYSIEDNPHILYTSDIYLEAIISENAMCTETLIPSSFYNEELVTHFANGYNMYYSANYISLYDLTYTYEIYCEDQLGNNRTSTFDIEVDKVLVIYDESPLGGTISVNTMALSLSTTKSGNCLYVRLDESGPASAYQDMGAPTQSGTPTQYSFNTVLTNLNTDLYEYYVLCSGTDWNDTTRLYFTVDRTPPITSFYSLKENGEKEEFSPTAWYSIPSDFKLECEDMPNNLASPGEPFGCEQSSWCRCTGTGCSCNPSTELDTITATEPATFCYSSTDFGGNIEDVQCKYIKMDTNPPSLPFVDDTSPISYYSEYYFKEDSLRAMWQAYDDESGIAYYLVQLRDEDDYMIIDWTEKTEEDVWVWFNQDDEANWIRDQEGDKIDLENGTEYFFYVKAVDNTGLESEIGSSDGITVEYSRIPDHCKDEIRNQGETDVDCGGEDCPVCELTDGCVLPNDCETGFCHPYNRTCMIPTCYDGFRNGNESGVDCGGSCSKNCGIEECNDDDDCCDSDDDCASGVCDELTGRCEGSANSCLNGLWDPETETDVDCGGVCPQCCNVGIGCDFDDDCCSGKCSIDLVCEEPSCFDSLKNGAETDVDCGGGCPLCGDLRSCLTDDDCISGNCEFMVCSGTNDEDGDGMSDSWEENWCEGGDCEPDEDLDDDGLTNIQEYLQGTDPTNPDTDGDGYSDYKEYIKGTNPLDPDDKPKSGVLSWLIILLILILIALAGYVGYQKYQKSQKPKTPPKTTTPRVVSMRKMPPGKRPATKQDAMAKIDAIKQRRLAKGKEREDIFKAFETKPKEPEKAKETTTKKAAPKEAATKPKVTKPSKKIIKKGDVWDQLTELTDEELTKRGKTKDVHSQLASLYGKRLDTTSDQQLSTIVNKDKITRSNIVKVFTELATEQSLSKSVLKNLLSKMVKRNKITKTDVKGILQHLQENKAISKSDISSILSYIDKK